MKIACVQFLHSTKKISKATFFPLTLKHSSELSSYCGLIIPKGWPIVFLPEQSAQTVNCALYSVFY